MTPKQARDLYRNQLVYNVETQELGTVRTVEVYHWQVLIAWANGPQAWHDFNALSNVQLY